MLCSASSNLANLFIAKIAKNFKIPFLENPISQIQKNLNSSPPSSISLVPNNNIVRKKNSGDQENQNLLIHITDHLNKRGRVLVCGGIGTPASLESSLLYLFI